MIIQKIHNKWVRFWMHYAGLSIFGRLSTRLAILFLPPYKARIFLARLNSHGYISPDASIYHDELYLADNVFIGERVVIYQHKNGGPVKIGKGTSIHRDTIIETGQSGSLSIGDNTHIQPRCQFSSFKGNITIGAGVQIAPNCAFYPYNHSVAAGDLIRNQPLQTKGGIIISDHAWVGFGVIILDGVRIGKGAVIGAGSVVTRDIPDEAIAVGNPAKVIKMRRDIINHLSQSNSEGDVCTLE